MNSPRRKRPKIEFGYWPIKIKAHYLRWLIRYLNLPLTEWNPKDVMDWRRKKDKLYRINPLVSIPYYREGDLIVSKLGAIGMAMCMRAGRKDLVGSTPQKLVIIRTLQSSINELRSYAWELTSRTKDEIQDLAPNEMTLRICPIIEKFSKMLGDNEFLTGSLTIADFEFVHLMELFEWVCRANDIYNPFDNFRNLLELRGNLFDLPGVKEYVSSKEEISMPWFLPGKAAFENPKMN